MPDTLTKEQRRYCMSRVRGKDTSPEILVRRLLHRMGYRFRLHVGNLPGRPDIVLPRHRKIVFVHGCFWHGHRGCARAKRPSTNVEFWDQKIDGNIRRDRRTRTALQASGWKSLVVWQCQTKNLEKLCGRLDCFLTAT